MSIFAALRATRGRAYPTRVPCAFRGKTGQVVLDQIRTVDRGRIAGRLGRFGEEAQRAVLAALQELFAEQGRTPAACRRQRRLTRVKQEIELGAPVPFRD